MEDFDNLHKQWNELSDEHINILFLIADLDTEKDSSEIQSLYERAAELYHLILELEGRMLDCSVVSDDDSGD